MSEICGVFVGWQCKLWPLPLAWSSSEECVSRPFGAKICSLVLHLKQRETTGHPAIISQHNTVLVENQTLPEGTHLLLANTIHCLYMETSDYHMDTLLLFLFRLLEWYYYSLYFVYTYYYSIIYNTLDFSFFESIFMYTLLYMYTLLNS